jgi:hypothetical protein
LTVAGDTEMSSRNVGHRLPTNYAAWHSNEGLNYTAAEA